MDNINKQFYNYLWAYILVALSGCLGNVVDGIIVGNLISEDGVSAINLSKPINQFIFTLHLLINAGAGMLVAYALGNKNIGEAKCLFTRAFMLSIGLGVLLAVFGGIIFPDETAQLLCSNKQILPLANEYMRILLLGNPAFILMSFSSTSCSFNGLDGVSPVLQLLQSWGIWWASPSCLVIGSTQNTVASHSTSRSIISHHHGGTSSHKELLWLLPLSA